MNTVRVNLSGLKTLIRQVGEVEGLRAQVGLFADTAGRSAEPGRLASNPHIGAIQEFGRSFSVVGSRTTITIPERSWLRMPLNQHLGPIIKEKGLGWFRVLRERGAKRMLAMLGAVAEDVIQEAFSTGGWGAWAPLSKLTIRRKHSARILIESAQMRKAVSSRVV